MEYCHLYSVRCQSCGNPIAHLAEEYELYLEQEMLRNPLPSFSLIGRLTSAKGRALDRVGLELFCCREMLMNPVKEPFRAAVPEMVAGEVGPSDIEGLMALRASRSGTKKVVPATQVVALPLSTLIPAPEGFQAVVVEEEESLETNSSRLQIPGRIYKGPFDEPIRAGEPTLNPLYGNERVSVEVGESSLSGFPNFTQKLTGSTFLAV